MLLISFIIAHFRRVKRKKKGKKKGKVTSSLIFSKKKKIPKIR